MHAFAIRLCEPAQGGPETIEHQGCRPSNRWGRWERHYFSGDDSHGGFGAFGVRRPLRFLAYKLQLSDAQVTELAAILNDLKTERAQAAVDDRRSLAAFADAIATDAFAAPRAAEAAGIRVESGRRLQDAVVHALGRIHALLDADQRTRLAYLIRTGTLAL